jgi:hypothetical protein
MAQNEKQAKSIRDLIADQNKILKENLRIQAKSAGIDSDILNDQQDIANVLKDQVKNLKFQTSERSLIRKITSDINKISEKGYALGKEELGSLKGIEKLQKDRLALEQKIRLIRHQQQKFSQMAMTGDIKSRELNSSIAESLGEQGDQAAKLSLQLGQVEESSERIANSFGVKTFGAMKDIVALIPGLSRFSGPFDDAAEAARSTVTEMETTNMGIDKFKELRAEGVGIQEALEQAGVSAKDVNVGKFSEAQMSTSGISAGWDSIGKKIASVATVIVVFKELVKLLSASDKAAGELAKGMNMSYGEAQKMRGELRAQSQESDSIFSSTENLQESLMAINQTLGTNVMLNKADLETFTKLREIAGFTNEELMGMQAISLATGTSLEDNTKEFMAQATQASLANGVLLNEKSLMKDIGNVSAATTLSFGKNPGLIAQAVATTKALGMEMSKVEGLADSLLDFESSIEAELSAELLLGKNINLEKARQAALNNDLAGVAREISEQAGSAAEFGEMNRIQQEALAKAVGMSREDLGKTLFVQEQLAGATGEQAEKREKLLNARIAEVGIEQAQKELQDGSLENLEAQASVSERMDATMSKIKDSFMSIADAILQIVDPIVNVLSPILSSIATVVGYIVEGFISLAPALIPIMAIMSRMWLKTQAIAIMGVIKGAWMALGGLPVVGPALAIAAIAGGVGYIKSQQKVADGIAPSSKGPFTITDSYGAMATTTKGDSLMASPNVGKAESKGTTVIDNSEGNKLLAQIAKGLQRQKPVPLYQITRS